MFRRWVAVALVVLIVDWIVGAMCASGTLPHWVFLLFNIPFGALYVWMESSWVGTHYEWLGQTVSDAGSLAVFLFVVVAQSLLCFALYECLRKKRCPEVAA